MIKYKKIKPLFTALITTMDRYEQDTLTAEGLIDSTKQQGAIKEYQKVLAVGESVRGINVGDMVSINPTRFAVKKHQQGSLKDGVITDNPVVGYNFDIIEINNKPCLYLQDRDINFIIEDYDNLESNDLDSNESLS
jgi:hypothetical protein